VRHLLVVGALAFGASCPGLDRRNCPPIEPLMTGPYHSDGASRWRGDVGSFPHDNKQPKVLQVDRSAGRLRISYRRGGKQVVETWRPKHPGEWLFAIGARSD
jgi:hypothetical protein